MPSAFRIHPHDTKYLNNYPNSVLFFKPKSSVSNYKWPCFASHKCPAGRVESHVEQMDNLLKKKKAMNLKERKGENIGGLGAGREWRDDVIVLSSQK